jgi:hypothetical protein
MAGAVENGGFTGGMGAMPSLVSAPAAGSGIGTSIGSAPHHGAVLLVLVAVGVLLLLDKAGFRFAVTAGKR